MAKDAEIVVRGYHIDVYGHVNNARYLEFLEEGRWIHLNSLDLFNVCKEQKLGFAVVNININYKYPAKMNDVLVIKTSMGGYTSRTATMKQTIYLKGTDTIVVDADVTFVMFSLETNKAVYFTDEMKALFNKADEMS